VFSIPVYYSIIYHLAILKINIYFLDIRSDLW